MPETVWGKLSVFAPLKVGFETATVLFTDQRMIVVFLGKRTSSLMLSSFVRALTSIFKNSSEARRRRMLESSTPDELLARDSSNFAFTYDELIRASLIYQGRGAQEKSKLEVVTPNDKIVFQLVSSRPPVGFDDRMRQYLGDRFQTSTTRMAA